MNIEELFEKEAKLSYQERKELPEEAFALPELRKFPIHDAKHVRNAWSRLSSSTLDEESKTKAKKAILAKAKEFEIDTSTWKAAAPIEELLLKEALYEEQINSLVKGFSGLNNTKTKLDSSLTEAYKKLISTTEQIGSNIEIDLRDPLTKLTDTIVAKFKGKSKKASPVEELLLKEAREYFSRDLDSKDGIIAEIDRIKRNRAINNINKLTDAEYDAYKNSTGSHWDNVGTGALFGTLLASLPVVALSPKSITSNEALMTMLAGATAGGVVGSLKSKNDRSWRGYINTLEAERDAHKDASELIDDIVKEAGIASAAKNKAIEIREANAARKASKEAPKPIDAPTGHNDGGGVDISEASNAGPATGSATANAAKEAENSQKAIGTVEGDKAANKKRDFYKNPWITGAAGLGLGGGAGIVGANSNRAY